MNKSHIDLDFIYYIAKIIKYAIIVMPPYIVANEVMLIESKRKANILYAVKPTAN